MPRRSVLFSPGHRPALLRGAAETDADVLVFDLEDAVPPPKKTEARHEVRQALAAIDVEAELCVRINPGAPGEADLQALTSGEHLPEAIMVPKVSTADDIAQVHAAVKTHFDTPRPLFALIEQASGVEHAVAIAQHEQTTALVYGAEDLAADIGASPTPEGCELEYARQRVVHAAAIGGIDPIDTVHLDIEDTAGLRERADRARRLGYVGKIAIHPQQIEPIHETFTPDEEDRRWAREILSAPGAEEGGVYRVGDQMVDEPIREQARRILRQAGELTEETG